MYPNSKYNIWQHSAIIRKLYAERCRDEIEEMTCARQCAEILQPLLDEGATVLDAGCGSGYYWHSLRRYGVRCQYYGIDYAPTLIDIGRRLMPDYDLPATRLSTAMIEDLDTQYDAVVCFNVLPWLPHYHQALERLCAASNRYLLIRTALAPQEHIRYQLDGYLDDGYNHLNAYWNIYAQADFEGFMQERGFQIRQIRDERTDDGVEMVVDIPFPWRIVLGERVETNSGQ